MTEGLLREEEIVEEIHGVLDDENENDDVEVAGRSEYTPINPSSQQGWIQGVGAWPPIQQCFL